MSSPKNHRILVVDDNSDTLFFLSTVLKAEGYVVELATNGDSALAKITASPPDLVLLDVMMPGLDGFQVTQWLRQQPHLSSLPILLLTAYLDVDMVEGLDIGSDMFLYKPLDVPVLLARIRALLRFQDARAQQYHMSR